MVVLRVAVNFFDICGGRAKEILLAVAEGEDFIANEVMMIKIMRNHQDGDVVLAVEIESKLVKFLFGLMVEIIAGLVEN